MIVNFFLHQHMFYKDICPFVQRERVVISAGLKHDIIREKHETRGSENIRGSSTFYPFEFVTCNYRYHVYGRLKRKSFINDETPSTSLHILRSYVSQSL